MTELPASLPGYVILPNRLLGCGTEAVVTAAIDRASLFRVALKVYHKRSKSAVHLACMRNEARTLRTALPRHPNVLRALGEAETDEFFALALEYATLGDLYVMVCKNKHLSEELAADIGSQVAAGLAHVHASGFVHNDVKLDNVLIFPGDRFVLSDFGYVAQIDKPNSAWGVSDACGTLGYAAPELLNRTGRRGASADVWAFAVLLYAMVTGCMPFRDHTDTIFGEFYPPKRVSKEFTALVGFAFETDPKLRPSLAQIRDHAWFKLHSK